MLIRGFREQRTAIVQGHARLFSPQKQQVVSYFSSFSSLPPLCSLAAQHCQGRDRKWRVLPVTQFALLHGDQNEDEMTLQACDVLAFPSLGGK